MRSLRVWRHLGWSGAAARFIAMAGTAIITLEFAACGGSGASKGSGGEKGSGGAASTGGATGSGGSTSFGGTTGSGGTISSGGQMGTGGAGGAAGIGDTVSCAGQASGTWISMSKTNAPYSIQNLAPGGATGFGAGLFWTGAELYTYSSATNTSAAGSERTAALYTPCADTWRASPTPASAYPSFVVPVVSANELLFLDPLFSPPVFAGFQYRQNQLANLSVTGVIAASFTTVVSTGSKLIEWGGAIPRDPKSASDFHGSQAGGVYDPASNIWSPTTMSGAPSARVGPGVWTGSSFAVWGGHSGDTYMKDGYSYDCGQYPDGAGCAEYGDGALYDPARDAWTAISATGAPSPRFNHVLAWTGDRLLVWGGSTKGTMTTSGDLLNEVPIIDGGLYDPAAKAWTPVAASPVPATASTMIGYYVVWTGDRLVVGQSTLGTGWLYDPHLDTWSTFTFPDGFTTSSNNTPLVQAGALIAWGSSTTTSAIMLLLPGETVWRAYPVPSGIANSPSVLWTGKHLFLWGGVFPPPPQGTCPLPGGSGCDAPPPKYSNAGFMLLP